MTEGHRPPIPYAPQPLVLPQDGDQPGGANTNVEILGQRTNAIEGILDKMKQDFAKDISEMANAIRQLVALQNANAATAEAVAAQAAEEARNNLRQNANGLGQAGQNQAAGEGGPNLNRGDGLLEYHRDRVKLVRDIHQTLQAISEAPLLSSANLSDFDQWANKLMNATKTDKARYNWINIDLIYGSINLDLRDQATGHVPSKLHLAHLIMPEAYLADLERLYTPADHLSA